jgi:HSP20 family protein
LPARWNPWEEIQQLDRQMSQLSRRAFGGKRGSEETLVPAVDVFSRGGDLVIRAELPGIDPDRDVDVSVQDGLLIIRGEHRQEGRTEEKDYVRVESSYAAFQRTIPLPQGVQEEDIRVSYENGILEVVVPGGARSRAATKVRVSAVSKRSDGLKAVGSGEKRTKRTSKK